MQVGRRTKLELSTTLTNKLAKDGASTAQLSIGSYSNESKLAFTKVVWAENISLRPHCCATQKLTL